MILALVALAKNIRSVAENSLFYLDIKRSLFELFVIFYAG